MIPYQFFREITAPRIKRIFIEFKKSGSLANWLHIAGPTHSILPYYSELGVDIGNFDYCVNPDNAIEALPNTCLDGNIKPADFIESEPEFIAENTTKLINDFSERGGFIVSSGCEIPPESKSENIKAMINQVLKS